MSWGSLNMAGSSLGALMSLLFLASITQGHEAVPVFCHKTWRAVVGQNVVLPCTTLNRTDFKIASTEWRKKTGESAEAKLVLYSTTYGVHQFWPNVSINTMKDDESAFVGFPINLSAVTLWDSGIYVCVITSFPFGSLRCETELKIKDIDNITCDVSGTVEAQSGENVTIHCAAFPNVQYRWTKNQTLVSDTESLELWQVSEAHSGIYTLTVNTGSKSLHEEFNITVLTVTTSLTTDVATVSPHSVVTTQGPSDSVNSLSTTSHPSPTTEQWTTAASVTWSRSLATDVTGAATNASNATNAAEERKTPFTNGTHTSVTSATATGHPLNSAAFNQTQETTRDGLKNESATQPHKVATITPEESSVLGNVTGNHENSGVEAQGNERSHLLALIMLPLLVLIAVAGLLTRRHIIKQRMDLPPPFKPPPPPVKYVAAVYKHCEISYPISRCNSLAECI